MASELQHPWLDSIARRRARSLWAIYSRSALIVAVRYSPDIHHSGRAIQKGGTGSWGRDNGALQRHRMAALPRRLGFCHYLTSEVTSLALRRPKPDLEVQNAAMSGDCPLSGTACSGQSALASQCYRVHPVASTKSQQMGSRNRSRRVAVPRATSFADTVRVDGGRNQPLGCSKSSETRAGGLT